MPELCKTHNLVLATDGKCVLCRRPKLPIFAVREETEDMISRVFTWLLGACLLAAFAALLYVTQLDAGYEGAKYVAAPGQGRADGSAPNLGAPRTAAGVANAKEQAASAEAAQSPAQPEAKSTAGKTATAAKNPSPTRPPAAIAAPETQARPVQHEVSGAARASVNVTMYAAPWCYICDRARDFMGARDVGFKEIDIERDPAGARRLAKLNQTMTVPTFEIEGRAYVGFNPWDLEDAIRDAALQHVAAANPPAKVEVR
jgi:glutaredoxin